MKNPAASSLTVTLRIARVRADSWVVGAFLVLVGVAVSAAAPQILSAVRVAVSHANSAPGPRDTAQRPQVRLSLSHIQLVEPKAPGGHDLLGATAVGATSAESGDKVFVRPILYRARILQRGFNARAPPSLNA